MANVTTYLDNAARQQSRGLRGITRSKAVANAAAASGDRIQFLTIPVGQNLRLHSASLLVDATLGASCTLKLQVDRGGSYTDITSATTAGGASRVTGAALTTVPFDLQGGDVISALVGGANIGAAANVAIDLLVTPR